MNKLRSFFLCFFCFSLWSYSQSVTDLIDKIDLDSLSLKLQEFSGEISTVVNGSTEIILNRQQANNDLAADYIKEKFLSLDNLSVLDQPFNTNGRNIIATQIGKTNPDDIYIICAHYDSVADYCTDDNASGTVTILEISRILSTQCIENTIVYALWDEEENGLQGSGFYASLANANNDNILGVLNIDMMAYDGDDDNVFDIDVRPIANSLDIKDDILSVLSTYGFNLNALVVNPGTAASDHSRFWNNGFSAALIGESWENDDETPFYHSSGDRYATLDLPYYHEFAKLIAAYMITKGGLIAVDNTISQNDTTLSANQGSASYQWIDCDSNMPITGENNQSFNPISDGTYAVEITSGSCVEKSDCFVFSTLNIDSILNSEINIYPNPVNDQLNIEFEISGNRTFKLYDILGQSIQTSQSNLQTTSLSFKTLPNGIYFLNISMSETSKTYKIIKR